MKEKKTEAILKSMGVEDSKLIPEEKMMNIASQLNQMDPEVAKKIIDQFPDFSKHIEALASGYLDFINACLQNNEQSTNCVYEADKQTLECLLAQLKDDHLDSSLKIEILEKIMIVHKDLHDKDTENKEYHLKTQKLLFSVLGAFALALVIVLGVKTDFKLPKK